MRVPRFGVVGLLVAVAVAGCASREADGPGPSEFHAEGSRAMLMPPAGPFDGSGVVALQGSALVHTFDGTNSGYVDVNVTMPDGNRISVHWTRFANQPNATWQDGGIASNVVEHGASGHGNRMEPQMDLLSGGWGRAQLSMDGQPYLDPVSGSADWNAHYMVTKESMMDPTTHAVLKSDRRTPFDPATPGDSYVIPNHRELHVGFWSVGAFKDGLFQTGPATNATRLTDAVTDPHYAKAWPITVGSTMAKVKIEASMSSGAGRLTFTLKDPGGQPVATTDVTPVGGGTLSLPDGPAQIGRYTLEVTGAGVQAAYAAAVAVTAPQPVWIHVVFEEVKLG